MPDPRPTLPHSMSRPPTGPQSPVAGTITLAVDDLELMLQRAAEQGALRGNEAMKLRGDVRVGLDQSQTISSLTGQLRNARVIIGLLTGLAGSVGAMAATCAGKYQERKEEILAPLAVAEAKAERAEVRAEGVGATLAVRLDAADARVAAVEANVNAIKEALDANTAAVLGIAAKLDNEKKPGKKDR